MSTLIASCRIANPRFPRPMALLGLSLSFLAACQPLSPPPVIAPTTQHTQSASRGSTEANGLPEAFSRIERLEKALTLFVCGPQLKTLLNEARAMCSAEESASKQTVPMCDEVKLKVPLAVAASELLSPNPVARPGRGGARQKDRELNEQNMGGKLMALRHEVLYLDNGKPSDYRKDRLRTFAEENRLSFTRFLIIADGEGAQGRAEAARQALEEQLRESGAVADHQKIDTLFEPPWIIPMRVKLYGPDSRQEGADPKGPAVFIFRTDCPE